jgi:hypothetical protein
MASDDQPPVREAVAYFHDAEALFGAISALESHGFDRAELSLLARESLLEGRLRTGYADIHAAEDDPHAARQPVVDDTDVRQVRTLATGVAGAVAAQAAAGVTLLTGGIAAAALAALAAGGFAAALTTSLGRQAGRGEQEFLAEQLARGGIILWVKTPTPAKERAAAAILTEHGGTEVHIRAMPTAPAGGA